jgi:hypothetical protein
MIVYKTRGASFEYQSDTKILIQNWKEFITSEQFRKALDETVDFVKKNDVKAILNNTLEQSVVNKADTKYAASLMPQLFMDGIKSMAIILPEDIFTQISVKRFEVDTRGANVKMFTEVNSAMAWIKSQG